MLLLDINSIPFYLSSFRPWRIIISGFLGLYFFLWQTGLNSHSDYNFTSEMKRYAEIRSMNIFSRSQIRLGSIWQPIFLFGSYFYSNIYIKQSYYTNTCIWLLNTLKICHPSNVAAFNNQFFLCSFIFILMYICWTIINK